MIHLNQGGLITFLAFPIIAFCRWLGTNYPETLVRIRYFFRFKRRLNLVNPKTLNEKILYLSLKTDTTEWTRLADKAEVYYYVKECGLEDILIPRYGCWNSLDDINLEKLPNEFVLKTTHGSGDVLIVRGEKPDKKSVVAHFKRYMKPFGALEGGKHYMRIKPRIVAEALIRNDERSSQYSSSIIDYKLWCFNGRVEFIYVCTNRTKKSVDVMTYDRNWIAHPEYSIFMDDYKEADLIPPPENLSRMIEIAERLCKEFPCVRCDLYNIAGRIYFGEMTFTSVGGMDNSYSEEFLNLAGDMIEL